MPGSAAYLDLPFDEAIAFFKDKVGLPTETWKDLWEGMHSRAFVVAGAMKADLLTDLRGAVEKGIAQGTTLAEFRKDFDRAVGKHGWGYKGGRNWRTATIFNTNLSTAYSAGHYQQMIDPDVLAARPYWRYVPSSSAEPRAEHQAWYGVTLPADDPWWRTHYPPNGWGCKCGVISMSRAEYEREKEAGAIQTTAPQDETYEWTDKATGEVHKIPAGIGPGWAYNPGEAAWGRNQALRLMEDQGPWVDLNPRFPEHFNRPEKVEVDDPRAALGQRAKPGDAAALRKTLSDAIGGDAADLTDPAGGVIRVTQAITDHILEKPETRWDGREAFFPFIPELIDAPYEIWISFARSEISGRVALRRRYVKAVRLGKKRGLGLVAESERGMWTGLTFFRGKLDGLNNMRKGTLIWGRS